MKSSLPKILVIVGPTASGKSDLAIKIAQYLSNISRIKSNKIRIREKFESIRGQFDINSSSFGDYSRNGAEIVSADSRQIYRGMDIGTAKPPRDLSGPPQMRSNAKRISNSIFEDHSRSFDFYSRSIKHHLINIKNPDEEYTVAQYKRDCLRAIRGITKRGNLPILVGGTGLYIKAVLDNLEIPKIKPNLQLRKKLERELKLKGVNFLYEKLIKLDPEAAYIVDRHNPRRVIRSLEITLSTQKPFSVQRKQGKKLFNALKIGISLPKNKLRKRIDERVDWMIRAGLINETEQLIKQYDSNLTSFDAIGYREIIRYLQDGISLSRAIALIKRNTWHYAKRQMTWFRADKEIKWVKNQAEAFKLINNFLKKSL